MVSVKKTCAVMSYFYPSVSMLLIRGSLYIDFVKDDHLKKPRTNVNLLHAHLLMAVFKKL